MTTVKTYLVRKPSDLDEVIDMTRQYGTQKSEEVIIIKTIALDEQTYKNVSEHPLLDREFLAGKGGYNEDGQRTVVRLTCKGKKDLLVDPSGSAYCRYLGIEVAD